MSGKPIAWSFSRLQTYRQCPYKYYRQHMLAKGDPEHIDPYGGARTDAMVEGDQMHAAFENAIRYGAKLPTKYQKHADKIETIRGKAAQSNSYRVQCEKQMAITAKLKPAGWFDKDAWGRAQADVEIHAYGPAAGQGIEYVDWKSGKPRSEWVAQGAAMAAVAFFVYPGLQEMHWRVEYVNYDETKQISFERKNINDIYRDILETTRDIRDAHHAGQWPTRASGLCGWCAVFDCPEHPGHN